jgi:spermidine synthase
MLALHRNMTSRSLSFAVAASMLLAAEILLRVEKRAGKPFFAEGPSEPAAWNPQRLLLASFLTLFAEVAFIRWIAVEVRVFAYVKNLAVLLCFLGFGLGCALVKSNIRWSTALKAFFGLFLVIRIPWPGGRLLEGLSQGLGAGEDANIWLAPHTTLWIDFLISATLAGCIFMLLALVFVPLGQVVSQQMDRAPKSLRAYSWNLWGSLVGVVLFFLVSRWMLPPSMWMGTILLGFALLQANGRDAILVASLVVPLGLFLHDPVQANTKILWTPYQQIQYTREYTPTGEMWGGTLLVNHTLYQATVDLSSGFLARQPYLSREADHNPYNIPFQFAVPSPSVLVVGSGTGNDVAAALRHDSRSVDAVEIDPAILELGKLEHPEHPYDSPRVAIHLGDARNFLKRTKSQYDLILFGLLDSHGQFSDYSNMRIDNFVYTEEAFREAARHLSPQGIIFVKFQVDRPWLANRISEMLRQVLGASPLIFKADSIYSVGATCFVDSAGSRVQDALISDKKLADFTRSNAVQLDPGQVPITTDNWPYLYQKDHKIPRTYYSVSLLVIMVALILYTRVWRAAPNSAGLSIFFFSMGAGFLLIETQIISRLALFFGTIWQVSGIVISALLITLLLANIVVERMEIKSKDWILAGLLASLVLAYWCPFDRIAATPTTVGAVAIMIFCIPVWFAGILFSAEFKRTASPSAALMANVLGAVIGGLLESLSLVFGLRALLLVAIGLYLLAGFGLRREGPATGWLAEGTTKGKAQSEAT